MKDHAAVQLANDPDFTYCRCAKIPVSKRRAIKTLAFFKTALNRIE